MNEYDENEDFNLVQNDQIQRNATSAVKQAEGGKGQGDPVNFRVQSSQSKRSLVSKSSLRYRIDGAADQDN